MRSNLAVCLLVTSAAVAGCTGSTSDADSTDSNSQAGNRGGSRSSSGGGGGNNSYAGNGGNSAAGGNSSAVAGSGGSPTMPQVVGKGIIDCPAVAPPAYTLVPAGGTLSYRFQSTCAACHGAGGTGRPGYPALPGALTLEQYKSFVRNGKGTNMPSFDASAISDADLATDFSALKAGKGSTGAAVANARTRPETWSAEKQRQILERGVQMLRKPDKFGTACANCHSPDAIELAAIAFTDDDIMRRALQHVSSEDALDLVDYVHAMRMKYSVKNPCSKLWRPFQPGGEPLPGNSVQEREVNFGKELEKRNLILATKPVTTLAEAKAAFDDLEKVSLRTLPVGVTFPRWSEDGFNGPEHKSFNDWMPGAGRVPKQAASWYALHDKYLADPTIANLSAIHHTLGTQTVLSKADSHGREITANFTTAYNAQGWMEDVLFMKHQSVLLGAHFFRMALLGKPGWLERPALPFPELAADYGPFFHQGLINAEPYCYSNEGCNQEITARLPAFMKEEFGPGETVTKMQLETLSDPWSYLGQLQDHTLLTAENFRGPTQDGHYWNLFTFEHRQIQQPFFSAHRIVNQQAYATKYRGTDKYPTALDKAAQESGPGTGVALTPLPLGTTPLLHGDWTDIQGLGGETIDLKDPRAESSLFLRLNIASMIAFLQRDLLAKGANVSAKAKLLNKLGLIDEMPKLLDKAKADSAWMAAHPKIKDNVAAWSGLKALAIEVRQLMMAAKEVSDPWDR